MMSRRHRAAALATVAALLTALDGAAHAQAPHADGPAPVVAPAPVPLDAPAQVDPVPVLYDDAVVHDFRLTFERDDWLAQLGCQRAGGGSGGGSVSKTDIPAMLEVDGARIDRIGVRCKGNSSLSIGNTKKPLNLTIDSFVAGQDLWGFDVINLNNNWNDASQVREALALKLLGQYMPAPRVGFARVSAQGRVLGLYTLVEQVEGTWADHWFPGDEGTVVRGDSPNRIVFDSSKLTWEGESLAPYKSGYEVKGAAAGDDSGYAAIRELTRALDAPESAGGLSDADFADGIRSELDVDHALWYLAGSNLIANYDSYYVGKNYYLYRSQRAGLFHMVSWDLGLSFGLFGLRGPGQGMGAPGGGNPATADPFAQENEAERPLIRRLLKVPAYRADYLAHYRTLYHAVFTPEWIEEVGDSYQALIRPAVQDEIAAQGNLSGSFTLAQFDANLREPIAGGGFGGRPGGTRPGVLSLVDERRAYLAPQAWLVAPDVRLAGQALAPAAPRSADPVVVTARFEGAHRPITVEVRYRAQAGRAEERVAMAPGEDGSWSAQLPGQSAGRTVRYAFRVAVEDGRAAFLPEANLTAPYTYTVAGASLPRVPAGALVLNELMAANTATLADEAGEFEDWVELVNRGTQPVELDGYFLSDDPEDPWAFALPGGTLAPGEHRLIWCDGDTGQGPNHAPFRLDRGGESLVLATADAVVDAVDFGEQATDVSFARATDGGEDWITCPAPSPGRANACDTAGAPSTTAYLPLARRD